MNIRTTGREWRWSRSKLKEYVLAEFLPLLLLLLLS